MVLPIVKMYGDGIAELMMMPQQRKVCKTSDGTLHAISCFAPPGFPTPQASYISWSYSRDNGSIWINQIIYTHPPGEGDWDFLALCCDSTGNLYFVRDDQKAGSIQTTKLFFRKATVDKTNPSFWNWNWGSEIQVGPENSQGSVPDIIVDSHNYIHIVSMRSAYPTSWASSRDGGITWVIGRLYSAIPGSTFPRMMIPSIDLDSLDSLYVGIGSYVGATFPRLNFAQKLTYTGETSTCAELISGDDNYVPVYTTYWKAQTFKTGGVPQKVNQISIKMYRQGTFGSAPGSKEITLSIRGIDINGHPTGADLVTGTFYIDNYFPASPNFIWVNVAVPSITLNANTKYAVVVRFPSGSSATAYLAWRVDATAPPYTNGNLETSTNSGGAWTTDLTRDTMFGVYCIPWDIGTLNAVSSTNSGYCQLMVLPDDRICLAYDLNGHNVIFRKTVNPRDITIWNPEVPIANGTGAGFFNEFSFGCNDANNLFAVYLMSSINPNSDVVLSRSTDGGNTWSLPEFLTNDNLGNRNPCILKEVTVPYPNYPMIVFRDGVYGSSGGDYGQNTAGNLWFMPADPPVHLESLQDDSSTSNLGTITFDSIAYALPNDIVELVGSYPALYNPTSGYGFDHWVVTDGISVLDPTANPTTVTVVSLGGTLRAIYKATASSADEIYRTHFLGFLSSGEVPICYLGKNIIITKDGALYLKLGNGNLIQLA